MGMRIPFLIACLFCCLGLKSSAQAVNPNPNWSFATAARESVEENQQKSVSAKPSLEITNIPRKLREEKLQIERQKVANPKQSEEYTNLLKIIEAYQQGQPASVSDLQTSSGKKLCDEFYIQPGIFKLPALELVGFAYAHKAGYFGQIIEDDYGEEHRLKFVFKTNPNSQGQIIKATFYRQHDAWCFHDIIFDDNQCASALSATELHERLAMMINANINPLITAAHAVMITPPNDFNRFKAAITQVQETAQFGGFGQRKEVEEFISAAGRLEAFATEWNQTIEAVTDDKFSGQVNAMIDAKVHASLNGIPGVGAEAELEAQIKKEIESTLHQTLNALSPKDADEYELRMDRLRKAYNTVLSLTQS